LPRPKRIEENAMQAELTLHYHPLSSFCWKALIALYEHGAAFTPRLVDLQQAQERAALCALWPMGKFPVLSDAARGRHVAESSIIIEYLDQHHRGAAALIPAGAEVALAARRLDRVFDLYVHLPMQKVVGDRLRAAAARDPQGVAEARATMRTAYGLLERELNGHAWALGESFTLADCAAAPALWYGNRVNPIGAEHPRLAAYLERLQQRPSFARVLREAQPYLAMFPA
jgi:glutathione S-transferase